MVGCEGLKTAHIMRAFSHLLDLAPPFQGFSRSFFRLLKTKIESATENSKIQYRKHVCTFALLDPSPNARQDWEASFEKHDLTEQKAHHPG
jgi:hypothetical protein